MIPDPAPPAQVHPIVVRVYTWRDLQIMLAAMNAVRRSFPDTPFRIEWERLLDVVAFDTRTSSAEVTAHE